LHEPKSCSILCLQKPYLQTGQQGNIFWSSTCLNVLRVVELPESAVFEPSSQIGFDLLTNSLSALSQG